jgi:hypothetical protein
MKDGGETSGEDKGGEKVRTPEGNEGLRVYESALPRTRDGNLYLRRCARPLDKATDLATGINGRAIGNEPCHGKRLRRTSRELRGMAPIGRMKMCATGFGSW